MLETRIYITYLLHKCSKSLAINNKRKEERMCQEVWEKRFLDFPRLITHLNTPIPNANFWGRN